jgi:CHAT domain-containing protein/cytochrome c-type biogenesis protein CcmH/NrfG
LKIHLNSDQIDELLRHTADNQPAQTADRKHQEDAHTHLRDCPSCQSRMRAHQQGMERLAGLKSSAVSTPSPQCPRDDVWIEVAAGIGNRDSANHLNHAAQCDFCGPLLRQAKEDFADEVTSEERAQAAGLGSASADWQRSMAKRLLHGAHPKVEVVESKRGFARVMGIPWLQGFAAASGISLVALIAFWLTWHRPSPRETEPNQLLAAAYAENRTIETRIEGAGYAPLSQERGKDLQQERLSRPALLKAEAEIAEKLKADPDSVRWIQASGRASLLEGDPQSAIDSLETAQRLTEDNLSVSVDLASAYILRGQVAKQPNDFGRAIDMLKSVLASQPHNDVAQFNYAIALEEQLLKGDSIQAWEQFLKDHPDSPWATEAHGHLERLEQETRLREQRSNSPLMTPKQVSLAVEQPSQVDDIDARIEEYQELAAQQWLPQLLAPTSTSSIGLQNYQIALSALSTLLDERHQDKWLRDMMRATPGSPQIREAVQLMSDSERLVQSSDNDRALREAIRASSLFEREGVSAGSARAQFTIILINQLRHRNRQCAAMAHLLASNARAHGYQWIRIQSELESGICASMNDPVGLHCVQLALRLARAHGYRILESRAANAVSGEYRVLGDLNKAWIADAEGLRSYWAGDCPSLRGYNLLANLDEIVEQQRLWGLAAAILHESIRMIADNPDRAMRAFEQARLGEVLLSIGDIDGAEKSFRETQRLFQNVPAGSRRDILSAETEIGLAKADTERGNPQGAVNRLESIRGVVSRIPEDDLRLEYFQTSGIAWMHQGSLDQAEGNLDKALRLAEKGLHLVKSKDDRLKWSRRNKPVYQAMVELKLRTSPEQALAYWEWFKGAPLRGQKIRTQPITKAPVSQRVTPALLFDPSSLGTDTAVVSYAVFPRGVSVWVWDTTGIRQRWLKISEPALDSLAHRFVEHCSNPASSVEKVRSDGAAIYRQIVLPIEPWITRHHRLIFEPDGALNMLPLEALVNIRGDYLSDQFSVAVSSGVEYLAASRKWTGISRESVALVIGDPAVPGWTSLPDAEQEARTVAASFIHSHLLLHTEVSDSKIVREIPSVDVFHFSGHSSASVSSAGLVMGNSALFDGRKLHNANHQRTQLVVLSACVSARGTTGFFDDQDSFVENLAGAGIPEVIASRWMVDSSATAVLMQAFYSRLLAGQTVSDSLRGATQTLRASPRFARPYYWAGFAVFGTG